MGQPIWEQNAKQARASANRVGLRNLDPAVKRIIERTGPYTKTPSVRVVALCSSIDYVVRHDIPGAIVECGLWRGGSLMAAALRLVDLGVTDRPLYGFDTFAGMTSPTVEDGEFQMKRWRKEGVPREQRPENLAPGTSLEGVRDLLGRTAFPEQRIHLVKGPVEETVPGDAPPQISVLRLDTDFYSSTLHELIHLYPRLSPGGILIVDDYGGLEGARKAVDEYFEDVQIFMHRIDHTARIAVKQE
jgi:O-methyltransferase